MFVHKCKVKRNPQPNTNVAFGLQLVLTLMCQLQTILRKRLTCLQKSQREKQNDDALCISAVYHAPHIHEVFFLMEEMLETLTLVVNMLRPETIFP